MFKKIGRRGVYPSEAPFRFSCLGYSPGLTHKYLTRLEKLARDKHSSLLQKSVNYDHKKFYNIGPWKYFYLPYPLL
jgi:hypothetical protein